MGTLKERSTENFMRDVFNTYAIFFLIFFIKAYVVGTYQPRLVEVIQMSTHNIRFYKEVDKSTPVVIIFDY